MAWSTRQVAELAGTTVKAVRYYHRIGLLDVPERTANGYKRYEVEHLVRLVQIKRLSDLGVPLSEVASMGRAEEDPDEAIRVLDAELEAAVARLNRVRAEPAVILRHRAPAYVPSGFAPVSRDLSGRQRSLLMVYSTVLSEESMGEFREMLGEPEETDEEFEALPRTPATPRSRVSPRVCCRSSSRAARSIRGRRSRRRTRRAVRRTPNGRWPRRWCSCTTPRSCAY
ncbi:DNA-binding transcriptional MerR regulator [Nocardiopsis composta]|uniref:DNA-binding transcriptional MerR regulator n=2 Tax=Nocardiopsis composta TaxID=157465 RepID=A0A7W8QIA9_9ACTN|nr:DNA-binding transcriptional MerR regulator [Nocardiopsis composta]